MLREAINSDECTVGAAAGRTIISQLSAFARMIASASVARPSRISRTPCRYFDAEVVCNRGPLQIHIDQQRRPLRLPRNAQSEIDSGDSFSAPFGRRSDRKKLPIFLIHRLQHLGPQHVEHFGSRVSDVVANDSVLLQM